LIRIDLCLVHGLTETGGCIVGGMQDCLGMPQSMISQHLAKLKAAGIVTAKHSRNQVRYEIGSPLVRQVVELLCAGLANGSQRDRRTGV